MSFSEFTPEDYTLIAREYAELKEAARKRCGGPDELDVVQKAFDFANEAHKNIRRRSGEPYIMHPIAVAKIVVNDIGLGYKSISAALLHDVVEDTDYTVEDIRNLFGDKIATLVDGLTKIKVVLDNEDKNKSVVSSQSMQAENFKRILLTLNDDVRVVLIKLADRLHNCRTIEYMPEHKRDKILSETMFIFIPLAHRLGLYGVKSEMENIWLKYKEPAAFNDINQQIGLNMMDKGAQIDEVIEPIRALMEKTGFEFQIKKRVKTPYSIWHKMQTKKVTFKEIYDLYAIRIIFTPHANNKEAEREDCFRILSIITNAFEYKPERIRDWVNKPKGNGYEALHCTIFSKQGVWIEVQIRTRRMDDIAEKGIAAHWMYKQSGFVGENDSVMDQWLEKVREILVSPDVNAVELLDIIHRDLITQEIIVFTPKGEQRTVPKGATALDFAYLIHSHIGDKAIAAKVNSKLVALSHNLRSGDSVEILTAENEHPKREWLQFLQTRKARNQVMDYFKADRENTAAFGRKLLEDQLASLDYKLNEETLKAVMSHNEINSADELFFRIGLGIVKLGGMKDILADIDKPTRTWFSRFGFRRDKDIRKTDSYVIDKDDRKYVIATCCKPIPGDPVIGFKSPDGSITVHKKTCSVAESIASKHGDQVVIPQWESLGESNSFLVRISLRGVDRVGLLNDITRYISLVMNVNMRKLSLGTEQGIFEGFIDVYVTSREDLDKLVRKLSDIEGIQSVVRTDIE